MALYDFECTEHGTTEIFQFMENASSKFPCPKCGDIMSRIWTVPIITGDLPYIKRNNMITVKETEKMLHDKGETGMFKDSEDMDKYEHYAKKTL